MVATTNSTAELLEQIIYLFDSPVLALDAGRKIIAMNRKAEKVTGSTLEDLKGVLFSTALDIEDAIADTICPADYQAEIHDRQTWEDVSFAREGVEGQPVRVRRKMVELVNGDRAILLSLAPPDPWEMRKQDTVIPSPMVFFETDQNGNFRAGREFFEEVLGYEQGALEGKNLHDLIWRNQASAFAMTWTSILNGQHMKGREFSLKNSRSELQPFWFWLYQATGQFGRSVSVRGIAVNMGMERSLAFALEASEERFSVLFRDSSDPVMILSLEGEPLLVNHSFERITGIGAAQLFQNEKTWKDFIHAEELPMLEGNLKQCIDQEDETTFEARMVTLGSQDVWYEHKFSILHDENGEGCGILAVMRNVDRRKHLEKKLRGRVETMERKHQQAQGLISKLKRFLSEVNGLPAEKDSFLVGVCQLLYDMYQPRLVLINFREEEVKYQAHYPEEMLPEGMLEGWKEPDPTGMCAHLLDAAMPQYYNTLHEAEPYAQDPYTRAYDLKTYIGAPLLDPDGGMIGTLSMIDTKTRNFDNQDVELFTVAAMHIAARIKSHEHEEVKKRLEDNLLRAQKMEAVGMLAGGVAHDFNNILTGILGFSSHLLTKVEKDSDIYNDLSLIEQSAVRAAALTRQLLAFARKKSFAKKAVAMNEVVDGVMSIIKVSIAKNIEVDVSLQDDLPYVLGDSGQLNQVVMNLCLNAGDAMSENGGSLSVSTEQRVLTEDERNILPDASDEEHVCISVHDTGRGMSPDIQEHIFDPFFTTRSESGGTGLGLSIVYGIVTNHNGQIFIDSEEGRGSTFRIFLPVHEGELEDTENIPMAKLEGEEKILVVDDEDIIRKMVSEILGDKGYDVIPAASGMEALELLEQQAFPFDLIMLDIIMPQMDGEATFHEIRKIDKDVPILLTSGYTMNETRERLIEAGAVGIIYKPYRNVDLFLKLRKILDEKLPAKA